MGHDWNGWEATKEQAIAAQKIVTLKSIAKLYVSFDGTGVLIKRETEGRVPRALIVESKIRLLT